MKKSMFPVCAVVLAAVIAFSITGCDSGDGPGTGPAPPERFTTVDLQGAWSMHGVNTGLTLGTNRGGFYGSMTMTMSGNVSSGSIVLSGYVPNPTLSGSLVINESGFIGGTIVTNSAFWFVLDSGLMDISKKSIFYVDTTSHPTPENDLTVLIKEGGSFVPEDIEVNWHMFGLCTKSAVAGDSGAIYGDLNIGATGVPDGTFVQRGTSHNITGGSITVNAAGYIPLGNTIMLDTPATWTISSGKLDQSKTFGVFTSNTAFDGNMVVIIKTASLMSNSDLAGTWYIHGATGGAVTNGPITGTIIFSAAGAVTGGAIKLPGEVQSTILNGNFSVTPAGAVTGSFTHTGGTIEIESGRMDKSGRKMAFVDKNHLSLYLLIK